MGGGESFLAPFADCKQLFQQTELNRRCFPLYQGTQMLPSSYSRAQPGQLGPLIYERSMLILRDRKDVLNWFSNSHPREGYASPFCFFTNLIICFISSPYKKLLQGTAW